MSKRILFIFGMLLGWMNLSAQKQCTVSGFIEDYFTGERLGNATLYEPQTGKGVVSNNYGFYSMTLPEGECALRVDYVGYTPLFLTVYLRADTTLGIRMLPGGKLDEVIVTGKSSFIRPTEMGKHVLSLAQIRTMPSLLGESDVLKALQNLPGVNSGTEGTSGISVRGGSPDQTQILLDGVPVYNVNHLFGYFSVFNGEALQNLALYKSAIPARYGGRLSSILDISMKEGNVKKLAGNFSISPIAGTLTLEGPLKKDRISFLVSGRYTWLNALLQAGYKLFDIEDGLGYGFYDLNAKVNWRISPADRLYISCYNGRDGYYVQYKDQGKTSKFRYHWGNVSLSARWNHVVSHRMFFNTQVYYSRFRNAQDFRNYNSESGGFDWNKVYSDMEDVTGKIDFDFLPGENHHIRYGMAISRKLFAPEISYRKITGIDSLWRDDSKGNVWSAEFYVENDWKISRHWDMNVGLRMGKIWGEKFGYYLFEPRLSLAYSINSNNIIKASWSAMKQPLHLLTNSSLGLNTDLWVPITAQVKPGYSNLVSLGYHKSFKGIDCSVEAYYNDLHRMVRYKEGIPYLKQKDKSWQDYIYTGRGRAYGIEFMVNKSSGNLNGWISYTLSRSERSFDEIQNGKWFPFEYDRSHKLNLVADYKFPGNDTHKFLKILALNFTYASGNYITIGQQTYASAPLPGYDRWDKGDTWWDSREYINRPNNYQLPAYHHLDVAFHLKNRTGKGDSWTFSVYNIYFRQNPGFYYRHSRNGNTEIRKVAVFPFMPSITWSYKF